MFHPFSPTNSTNNESHFQWCYHFSLHSANRLSNFYVDVSNNADGSSAQQCAFEAVPFMKAETRVYTCPSAISGRYVRIRFAEAKREILELCKVQVQGGELFGYFSVTRPVRARELDMLQWRCNPMFVE